MVRIITLKQQKYSHSDPVLSTSVEKNCSPIQPWSGQNSLQSWSSPDPYSFLLSCCTSNIRMLTNSACSTEVSMDRIGYPAGYLRFFRIMDLDIYFWKIESRQDHDIGLISITKFPWEQRRSSHLDILDWSRGGKIRWSGKNWPTTLTYIVENILHFQKYSLEHKIGIDLTVSSTLKMPSKNYRFLFWDVSDYS